MSSETPVDGENNLAEPAAVSDNRWFTPRAIILALLAAVGFSILIPWNDWFLKNTYLNNHYMPLGLTLVLLVMGIAINPLLGRLRLRSGEMVVIAVVMLGLAGVTSSGLMRMFPYMVTGPASVLPTKPGYATAFAERGAPTPGQERGTIERWNVPHSLWMGVEAEGNIDRNDPEFRYLIEGYQRGLPRADDPSELRVDHRSLVSWEDAQGQHHRQLVLSGKEAQRRRSEGENNFIDLDDPATGASLMGARIGSRVMLGGEPIRIVDITPPSPPIGQWWLILLAWSPLLIGATLACVGIAGVVRRQWIHNERLPYPIANVTYTLLEDPAKGNFFADVFRSRAFWVALGITGAIIAWRGLFAYGLVPVDIQLSMNLYEGESAPFAGEPWSQMYQPRWLFRPQVFFSIIALTFFLALDLSFSLWFFFLATNVVFLLLRTSGVPITGNHVAQAGVGGFFAECVLIIWIGRQYYWRVVKAAIGLSPDGDAKAAAPYLWVLLGGCLSMVVFFAALGASISLSVLMVLLFLGFFLVLARIVAEAGVPYIGVPTGAFLNSVFFSLVGFGIPIALFMPLTVIGMTLLADSREAMLPYAVNADYLGDRSGAPRKRLTMVFVGAAVIGIVVALGTMVILSYGGDGHPDGYGRHVLESELGTIASGIEATTNQGSAEVAARRQTETLFSYGVGGLLVALLGAARLYMSWWPFHPIGYLASMTYATWNIWFSFFLGWMFKAIVMRYGGTGLYKQLKPAAIGMIAGEALAGGTFMLIKIIAYLNGMQVPDFRFLPG